MKDDLICQANTLDREYTLEYGLGKQDGVARPFLKGRMNTNIKWNITSGRSDMGSGGILESN